ncbi:MAG: UDP-N-acetylmuramoyl-tripeptide--D-alanyl-D-alanine ligase [Gemmatimonadota bacterium]
MRWTWERVHEVLEGQAPDVERPGDPYTGISTDTRTVASGNLFVALAGERFDGHGFLAAARDAGATGAVVRRGTQPVAGLIFHEVDEPLRAYGRLARARRREIAGPVVAVTGTNGKTSTKEMLAAALLTRYRVHATRLNLNNLVGVPQTILEAPDDADALVIEAGANAPGEIRRYRDIIEPSLSVVTNVGAGHLEGFGSIEGVMAEKVELVRDVPVAVVGTDPPELEGRARRLACRVVTAGVGAGEVRPDGITMEPSGRATLDFGSHRLTLGLLGEHQARNAALVWAVAMLLGLDLARVARALESVSIPGGRGQLTQLGAITVLHDAYNANPPSFLAAIDLAATLRNGRRLVFVAGTMRELGSKGAELHEEVAARLVALEPDLLVAVGGFEAALEPYRTHLGDRLIGAPDSVLAAERLAPRLSGNELVVLKGSRGVALERMLPTLAEAGRTVR